MICEFSIITELCQWLYNWHPLVWSVQSVAWNDILLATFDENFFSTYEFE